jgi:integrase
MIEASTKVVENAAAESWKFYLRGLWLSGLRLSESLTLAWESTPDAIVVDMTSHRPMLRIPAEAEKGFQNRTFPLTPDFARHLQIVPERERRGRVFNLLAAAAGTLFPARRWDIGRLVAKIGMAAGVVVDERRKGDETIRKFATAHFCRRSFGQRWALRLIPAVLQALMRHEDVSTSLTYYVGKHAETMVDTIWATEGSDLGSAGESAGSTAKKESVK